MNTSFLLVAFAATAAVAAQTTQHTVIPATHQTSDAPGRLWLPGGTVALRQQQVIDAVLLQGMVGQTITAIEFRRNAENTALAGGTLGLTVTLSITPTGPLTTSETFAQNVGPNPVQVWNGPLTLPASPANVTPTWMPADVLRIPFQSPFLYSGGNLCLDVVGSPIGTPAGWWPADAAAEPITATTTDRGGGCGPYGFVPGHWSFADVRTLLPGTTASFSAIGPSNSFAVVAFGVEDLTGWPLGLVLPQAPPSCTVHLALPIEIAVVPFLPNPPTNPRAEYRLPIPNSPNMPGVSLTTQWVEWTHQASSNAITWTIGTTPTLLMSHVEGAASDASGQVLVDRAHVVRFEHN